MERIKLSEIVGHEICCNYNHNERKIQNNVLSIYEYFILLSGKIQKLILISIL
jgi:hypothetical protein